MNKVLFVLDENLDVLERVCELETVPRAGDTIYIADGTFCDVDAVFLHIDTSPPEWHVHLKLGSHVDIRIIDELRRLGWKENE